MLDVTRLVFNCAGTSRAWDADELRDGVGVAGTVLISTLAACFVNVVVCG